MCVSCMYVYGYKYTCAGGRTEANLGCQYSGAVCLVSFGDTVSLWNLGLISWSTLYSQQVQGASCLSFPSIGFTSAHHCSQLLSGCCSSNQDTPSLVLNQELCPQSQCMVFA